MKRIIDGVAYNTASSTLIARNVVEPTENVWAKTSEFLYQTQGGAFFLHQHEVTPYKDPNGEWKERERHDFFPMARIQAQTWAMNDTELLADVFGDIPDATEQDTNADAAVVQTRLPPSLKRRIESAATTRSLSVNAYSIRCYERCLLENLP